MPFGIRNGVMNMIINCEKVFTNCRSTNAYNHKHTYLYQLYKFHIHSIKIMKTCVEQFSRLLPLNRNGVSYGEKS
jgi:hypothetical protein